MVAAALLGWSLVSAAPASAEGTWGLWSRSCDIRSQTCAGEWRRRETYEAERWCRAARATAVNKAFTPEAYKAAAARGTIEEYQCRSDTTTPPTGTK